MFDHIKNASVSAESYKVSVLVSFQFGFFFLASMLIFTVTNFYPDKYTISSLINACPYVLTCQWRAC